MYLIEQIDKNFVNVNHYIEMYQDNEDILCEILDLCILNDNIYYLKYILETYFKDNKDIIQQCMYSVMHYSGESLIETMNYLISIGGDINGNNDLLLVCACHYNYYDVIEYLIGLGANRYTDNDSVPFASKYGKYFDINKFIEEKK